MLRGKKILLGICGSIAAYKSAYLVRYLIKQEAEVRVIMTPASFDFVTPVTLATLSKNPVISSFYSDKSAGEWNNHVELGLWADLMLIAPATANTLASMANGICESIMLAAFLSARCPVWVCPAMDLDMYAHPSTQENLKLLKSRDVRILEPDEGELASGLIGAGRMQEPEVIANHVIEHFSDGQWLLGKKILITAGPTQEAIDPVRFIGNHSSGKMGYALALAAAELGAEVKLVSGPVSLSINHPNIEIVDVRSAADMNTAVQEYFPTCEIGIFAAAVADYRPSKISDSKIKKSSDTLSISLESTTDILATCGAMKSVTQTLIGFALETDNELIHAQGKLKKKNLDFIILNSLKENGAGFQHETNKITIIDKNNKLTEFGLKPKSKVANDILSYLKDYLS